MLNGFGWPHLLIIAALIIILFGAKRLPDAARGLGRSMRIFKGEMRGLHEDESAVTSPASPANPASTSAPAQLPPAQQPQATVSAEQTHAQNHQQQS